MRVKTKAELMRFIESFEMGQYLKFEQYKIVEPNENNVLETYSMNDFILDEIRKSEAKKRLVLYMRPTESNFFLTRDMLSFLISEVQLLYPEYHCEGKLTETPISG